LTTPPLTVRRLLLFAGTKRCAAGVEGGAMPVIAHVVLPGVTKEQYDEVRAAVNWLGQRPDGGLSHVTWWESGDCHNVDAWESAEAFQVFGETRLGPGMASAGVNVEPVVTFHEAHEVFLPEALTITA
jgi:hypothetical protein